MEVRQVGYKYSNSLLEWMHVANILETEILPILFGLVEDEFERLNKKQEILQAKINQLSFGNDPRRDKRIIDLFKSGYSRGIIAKEVGMSKWGVSKALRRLGVN